VVELRMGSYAILSGGVEVSNMSPVLSSGMPLQKPMYIMQEAPKPASQQVWVHAMPVSNSQALRPVANPTMLQAAPQAVPTVYSAAPRPLLAAQPQAQPNTFVSQAPGEMRLVQLPGGGIQVQQAQPQQQQQVVMAPVQQPQQLQPRQPGNEVVYVNVNGVLQQGVVQNGSVYLLSDSASAAGSNVMQLQAVPGQQAPMAVTVASRQPGISAAPVTVTNAAQVVQLPNGQFQQQQVQVAGQVLPGARLVPVSQAAVRPAQLPQMQAQQQHAQRTTMMVMQPNGAQPTFVQSSAPMGVVMMSGTQRAGMQQAAGAPAQQAQVQVPVSAQQLVARSPAAVPAAATTRPAGLQMPQAMQPVQFTNGAVLQQQQQQQHMRPAAAALNGLGVAGVTTAPNNQQASAQAFRPALAAGAKILVPSASVSASTASLGNKPPAAVTAAGLQQGQVALSSNNGSGIGVSQAVMVPMSGMQQQQQLVPGLNGEMSSPPVPPITPGVVMDAPAPAAPGGADGAANTNAGSTLLALLNGSSTGSPKNSDAGSGGDNSVVRMHAGSQSPSHGIIGSQRSSKDGMGASRSGTPAPAGSSPPRSQPGTPARSNSGGGLVATAAATTTSGSAHSNSNKGAVMRLVARSFIETGIALEQALTMIQPADKELLAAAFAAEAAGAPLPDSVPAAAADSAAANKINGVGGMIDGLGLGFGEGAKGGASTTDAMVAAPSSSNGSKGLFGGEGLSGLLNLSFADDVSCANDNNSINMGSWGFSLFTGSGISDLNGGAVGLSSLGPADPCLADVAAAPAAAQQPAGAAGKDSALAGMLASLNL
jgi:hypothetical protein